MQKITPNLWFNGNAAEAIDFYTTIFPHSRIVQTSYYPEEGLLEFQQPLAGKPLTVEFELANYAFTAINAGPEFSVNPAISFMVNFDPSTDPEARQHIDELWESLATDGSVLMPLDEYPFSARYGWIQDRFGVTWQLILTDPEGDPRPTIIPSLTFTGENTNRAKEAIDYYVSLFDDSQIGEIYPYEEATESAAAGSVMFADFTLAGQWFAADDSAVEQPFTFNEGVSLQITCRTQEEIDRLWSALSHVPEAEQCGWCKDRFGVSWQIVPENIAELMEKPGAYQKLMQMKKLEIAEF